MTVMIVAISYGGGVTLTIDGVGFDSESAEITVCNETCILINRTVTQILCDAPDVPSMYLRMISSIFLARLPRFEAFQLTIAAKAIPSSKLNIQKLL